MLSESPTLDATRRWLSEQGVDPDSPSGRWIAALLAFGEPVTENAPSEPAKEPAA
jgi:hypothetical protein